MRERESEVFASEKLQEEDQTKLVESLRRCHVNLGHPSHERFLHMLKSAGAGEKALQVAKGRVCETQKQPPSHPISKHNGATQFNKQVNLDTFEVPIYERKRVHMLSICDEATGMQVCVCVPLWKGNSSESVRKAWKRWAGCPVRVLTDNGLEFDGVMQQGLETDWSYVDKIAAYAPWQNGIAERHGGIWKSIFAKAMEESQPSNKKEINELVDHVNQAKNSMSRKTGYARFRKRPGVAW